MQYETNWEATLTAGSEHVTLTVQARTLAEATFRAGIAAAHKGYGELDVDDISVRELFQPVSSRAGDAFASAFGGITR